MIKSTRLKATCISKTLVGNSVKRGCQRCFLANKSYLDHCCDCSFMKMQNTSHLPSHYGWWIWICPWCWSIRGNETKNCSNAFLWVIPCPNHAIDACFYLSMCRLVILYVSTMFCPILTMMFYVFYSTHSTWLWCSTIGETSLSFCEQNLRSVLQALHHMVQKINFD